MKWSGQRHALAVLPTGMTRYTFIEGWVNPRTGPNGCGNSSPTGVRSPVRSVRSVQNKINGVKLVDTQAHISGTCVRPYLCKDSNICSYSCIHIVYVCMYVCLTHTRSFHIILSNTHLGNKDRNPVFKISNGYFVSTKLTGL